MKKKFKYWYYMSTLGLFILFGNITFTFIDSGHKEIWGAVFRCYRHNNTFSVLGKDIYSKVKVGQVVDLKYVELYKIKNNMKVIYDYKTIEVIVP